MPSLRRVFRNGAIKAIGIAGHAAGLIATGAQPEADTAAIGIVGAVREAVSTGTGIAAGTGEDTAEDATAPVLDPVLDLDPDPVAATMEVEAEVAGATTVEDANETGNATETPCWAASLMTGTAGHAGPRAVLPVEVEDVIRQIAAFLAAEERDVSSALSW